MKRGFLKNGLSGASNSTSTAALLPSKNSQTATAQATSETTKPENVTHAVSSAHPTANIIELKPFSETEWKESIQQQGLKTKRVDDMVDKPRDTAALSFGLSDVDPTHADTLVVTYRENRPRLREHPCFEQSLTVPLAASNASVVEVRPVPGKGVGLVAKRDIPAGQLIIRERPLLVMYREIRPEVVMNMDTVLAGMTKERRAAYDALYNCKSRGPQIHDSLSISRTNGLEISGSFFGEDLHLCVCELVSRANHDCTPNACFAFNQDDFCGELTSILPITAGTEITISYVAVMQPAAQRKAELLQKWAFICTCPACDEASPSFKAKDKRRRILQDYLQLEKIQELTDAGRRWTGYEDSYIEHILDVVDAERLDIYRAIVLANFAKWEAFRSRANGDYTRVVQLCRRGLKELSKLRTDKHDETRLLIQGLLEQAGITKQIRRAKHPSDYESMTLEDLIVDFRLNAGEDTAGPARRDLSIIANHLQRHLARHPEEAKKTMQEAEELTKVLRQLNEQYKVHGGSANED